MRLLKKAQTATEYLIILAVVIIIALIVVGIRGGIPSISLSGQNGTSTSYWGTSDIAITQFAASSATGDLDITLRNNLPNGITLTEVTVGTGTQTCDQTSLSPGQSTTCTDDDGAIDCSSEGDAFSYDVSIGYTDDETGGSYTFTGDGNTLDGSCAA
jgi:hypothetical protein